MTADKDTHIYCTECGTKLVEKTVGAEELLEGCGEFDWPRYYKYNERTGRRQYIKMMVCPRRSWLSWGHDKYFIDKVVYKKEVE
jgi:hypothetical protein